MFTVVVWEVLFRYVMKNSSGDKQTTKETCSVLYDLYLHDKVLHRLSLNISGRRRHHDVKGRRSNEGRV